MTGHDTHCCGVKELGKLASHATAADAFDAFCEQEVLQGISYRGALTSLNNVYANYIFTAAIYSEQFRNTYPAMRSYQLYGDEFAQFIIDNKLGVITTSPATKNAAFHPDHEVKIYIWTVDQAALRAFVGVFCPNLERRRLKVKIDAELKSKEVYISYLKNVKKGDYYFDEYNRRLAAIDKTIAKLQGETDTIVSHAESQTIVEAVMAQVEEKIEAA